MKCISRTVTTTVCTDTSRLGNADIEVDYFHKSPGPMRNGDSYEYCCRCIFLFSKHQNRKIDRGLQGSSHLLRVGSGQGLRDPTCEMLCSNDNFTLQLCL